MDQDAYSRVITAIYDTALTPARWPDVLAQLGGLFRSHMVGTVVTTPDRANPRSVGIFGLDAEDHRDFLRNWHKKSVWGGRRPVRRTGEIVTTDEIAPKSEFLRSEMFNAYLNPRDMHEGLRLDMLHEDGICWAISLCRSWSMGPYGPDEIRLARALMPHLQQAATLALRLRQANIQSEAAMLALDMFAHPVLLLDRTGLIVHISAAANTLLQQHDGLTATRAGLQAATPQLSTRLGILLAKAAGAGSNLPSAGALRLQRPSGRPALSLMAMPLAHSGEWLFPGHPAVLVHVHDPAAGAPPMATQLTTLYGMTHAEANLAAELLAGGSIADIAARLGRSLPTLRTHLARLMAKTQTHRQTDLIRLLANHPRPPAAS